MSFCGLPKWLLLLVTGAIVSCSGGGSCPFERPSCCDNALFGCGPFDLPQGCSCGDYFSRSFSGSALGVRAESEKKKAALTTNGSWRVALARTSGGCAYLDERVNQTLLIRERNKRLVVKVIGVGTMKGDRVDREAKVRGQFKTLSPLCVTEMWGDVRLVSSSALNVSSSIAVTCKEKKLSCTASYSGRGKRL